MPRYSVRFLGIPVADITTEETLEQVAAWVEEHRTGGPARQIITANPEFIIAALRQRNFRRAILQADLVIPDGIGLIMMAPLLGGHLRERVTGSDILPLIARQSARLGQRLYLLGAAPGVAEKTAAILVQQNPALQIAGCYAGSPARDEEETISKRIRDSHADILAVAFGAPKQDLWIARNLQRTGAATGIGVGGAFDHITGHRRRAPHYIRQAGLEWAFRLVTQPWRWRRMLALPLFVILVSLEAVGKAVVHRSCPPGASSHGAARH